MELLNRDGSPLNTLHSGEGLRVRLQYECHRDVPNLHFGLRIFSNLGVLLSDVQAWSLGQVIPLAPQGKGVAELEIDCLNLMPGTYYLGVWAGGLHEWYDVLDNVAKLEIEPCDYYGTGRGIERRLGLIFLPFRWTLSGDDRAATGAAGDHCTSGHDVDGAEPALSTSSFPGEP